MFRPLYSRLLAPPLAAWFSGPHRRPRPPPGPPVRPPPTVPTPRPRSPKTGRRELAIPSFPRNHTTYWLPLPILWPRWVARIGVTRSTQACFLAADRQCTELPLLRLPRLFP